MLHKNECVQIFSINFRYRLWIVNVWILHVLSWKDKMPLLLTEEIFFEICLDTPHKNIAQRLGRAYIDVETGKKKYDIEPVSLLRRNYLVSLC